MSFFIMAGSFRSVDAENPESIDTLSQSDPAGPRYTAQVNRIAATIGNFYPDANVETFTYTRATEGLRSGDGGWGKAAVGLRSRVKPFDMSSVTTRQDPFADKNIDRFFSIPTREHSLQDSCLRAPPLGQSTWKPSTLARSSGRTSKCQFGA